MSLEEVADVVEEGPEQDEGAEAAARAVHDDLIPRDEVLLDRELALERHGEADDAVKGEKSGEAPDIGVSQNAADYAAHDGEELEAVFGSHARVVFFLFFESRRYE